MPTPGIDCHIVIDGVGYVFADMPDAQQESQKEIGKEQLAPHFGDPTNVLDPLSSDLTMVLPIGQSDFSDGIGSTDLEKTPKGFERAENLIVTPQGTLINGPQVVSESFTASPPTGLVDGYFTGGLAASVIHSYLFLNDGRGFYFNGSTWADLTLPATTNHAGFYAGKAVVLWGDAGLSVYSGSVATTGTFLGHRFFILNGMPFLIYKDGRIYAAWIPRPPAFSAAIESGAIVAQRSWQYAISYVLPGSPDLQTELSPIFDITKTANGQVRLTLPVRTYRGGPVQRRLWRTTDLSTTPFYLIADTAVLGPTLTNYLDTADDAAITGLAQWGWTTINNTALNVLVRGVSGNNMSFPDTDPIFLPEDSVTPSTGSNVNNVVTFHDLQGNEAAVIGTTNGLFLWNGISRLTQTLRMLPYHSLNCKFMAVNHGVVYYTVAGTRARVWSEDSESELLGPWVVQFNVIREIKLQTAGKYVFFAVNGITKYDASECVIIYAFDGKSFTWSYRATGSTVFSTVMGELPGRDQLVWFEGNQGLTVFKNISLASNYSAFQTAGVVFRSSSSDLDLPRLRKSVQGVMVRYLQLTPQTSTTLANPVAINDVSITVASVPGDWVVGNWICVKELDLALAEYRKITAIAGNTITITHPLGAGFVFAHAAGIKVAKSGVVTTLRNIFTNTLPTQDIEIGGPCDAGDLFSLINLPWPVYTFSDGINLVYNSGVIMEIQGWAILTALNPAYNGLLDLSLRIQDNVKLPNSTHDAASASVRKQNLIDAYNKGAIVVIDPLNVVRNMRFQRLEFDYEEPKQRHQPSLNMQATAHVRLIDRNAELLKQETLTLSGSTRTAS